MGQDSKCFFGNHKFKLIKEETVAEHGTNKAGEHKLIAVIGLQLICQCSNCGKIKSWFIPTDSKFINRSVRA